MAVCPGRCQVRSFQRRRREAGSQGWGCSDYGYVRPVATPRGHPVHPPASEEVPEQDTVSEPLPLPSSPLDPQQNPQRASTSYRASPLLLWWLDGNWGRVLPRILAPRWLLGNPGPQGEREVKLSPRRAEALREEREGIFVFWILPFLSDGRWCLPGRKQQELKTWRLASWRVWPGGEVRASCES